MKKLILRQKPENKIQKKIIEMLAVRGWLVRVMTASETVKGFPDLYATHYKYGARWIEVKLPEMKGSSFTPAQLEWFPKMVSHGSPIWILTSNTEEEYKKLFRPQNFTTVHAHHFLKGIR